ncbi:MAG: protein kinase domain-containing protein [Frankia sp.]
MATVPEVKRTVAGRYRLVSRLGAGAMGTVWRAFDEVLQTEAALKEIEFAGGLDAAERADRVERALREARHAAKLRGHPNVVTVLDVVSEDGLPWIVMELVPSVSLFQQVRESGPLPPPEVARIGVALLDALSAAHELRILHRDVKPSNVLIGASGRVVLTDFGIATHDTDPTLTVTGLLGTPMYMSPERLNGEPATPEADLFGLGATLYYAVEGRPAFERDTFGAMLAAILMHPPTPTRRAGPLSGVLAGLLEKDPGRRLDAQTARRLLLDGPGPESQAARSGFPPSEPHADDQYREDPSARLGPGVVRADGLGWRARTLILPRDAATRIGVDLGPEPNLVPTPVPVPSPPGPERPAVPVGTDEPAVRPNPAGPQGSVGTSDPPGPPAQLVTSVEDGAVVVRWEPVQGAVSYRVVRITPDPEAPGGRRERSLGLTAGCELSDGGVGPGDLVWHEVRSVGANGARSEPARTAPRVLGAVVADLRAVMEGDAVAVTWRPDPDNDDVVIERRFDDRSPIRGAMRRVHASGGRFIDADVQPDAVYRYVVAVADGDAGQAVEVSVRVTPRPRPVCDLEAETARGTTTLRWTSVPGAVVRVYATDSSAVPGLAGTSPFGPADHEVAAPSLEGRARLVGESRRGRLSDAQAGGDVVYTPVSVAGDRAVLGEPVRHPPAG